MIVLERKRVGIKISMCLWVTIRILMKKISTRRPGSGILSQSMN